MDTLLFSLLNGVIYGLLLFMVSAGLTLVFGMMGVLNFAHASFYMLGAYFAYTLQGVLGFGAAVVVAMLAGRRRGRGGGALLPAACPPPWPRA
ncbi:MAG: hypothetical protein NVV73_01095 [Cellvibrionaceae bacterium]|nr:hypothetical protein [Cellvibrionaceae bacterium]